MVDTYLILLEIVCGVPVERRFSEESQRLGNEI